jgi:hypothetical protein
MISTERQNEKECQELVSIMHKQQLEIITRFEFLIKLTHFNAKLLLHLLHNDVIASL